MLEVGLTAVADHPSLAANGKTSTLKDLSQSFPIVEIDSGFYGVPKRSAVIGWRQQVPQQMRFIVKATQFMTRHKESDQVRADFLALADSLAPLQATQQLAAVLFQFPPYFGCTSQNVRYLRQVRAWYPQMPIAVEFRNAGWYLPQYQASTLSLLQQLKVTHVVVDEPQTASGSVPLVAQVTTPSFAMMRLHGQNRVGWESQKFGERTNYRYTDAELSALLKAAQALPAQQVAVIFNNNGGHDAADNALNFIAQAGLHYQNLAPKQLDLF